MPVLSEDIFAVPDGEIHPKWFRAGDNVTGQVAVAARDQGKLQAEVVEAKTPRRATKALKAPEVK